MNRRNKNQTFSKENWTGCTQPQPWFTHQLATSCSHTAEPWLQLLPLSRSQDSDWLLVLKLVGNKPDWVFLLCEGEGAYSVPSSRIPSHRLSGILVRGIWLDCLFWLLRRSARRRDGSLPLLSESDSTLSLLWSLRSLIETQLLLDMISIFEKLLTAASSSSTFFFSPISVHSAVWIAINGNRDQVKMFSEGHHQDRWAAWLRWTAQGVRVSPLTFARVPLTPVTLSTGSSRYRKWRDVYSFILWSTIGLHFVSFSFCFLLSPIYAKKARSASLFQIKKEIPLHYLLNISASDQTAPLVHFIFFATRPWRPSCLFI